MTTIENVTPGQIHSLRDNAATADDLEQVESCDLAAKTLRRDLRGLPAPRGGRKAIAQCVSAINAAEAMDSAGGPLAARDVGGALVRGREASSRSTEEESTCRS